MGLRLPLSSAGKLSLRMDYIKAEQNRSFWQLCFIKQINFIWKGKLHDILFSVSFLKKGTV